MLLKERFVEERLILVKKIVSIFLFIGIICSFKVWTSQRIFPLIPVFDILPALFPPLDVLLIFIVLGLLLLNILLDNKIVNASIILILIILLLFDQNRWQPWVYLYFLFLIQFVFNIKDSKEKERVNNCLQFILIAVYLWSAIHKFNPYFIDRTLHDILVKLLKLDPEQIGSLPKELGYIFPAFEFLIGILLLIPFSRKWGVYLATALHIFILIYLSPLGISHNSVVYPWNVAMIFLVFLLFFNKKNKINLLYYEETTAKALNLSVILLIGFLPLLNFFGHWDNYLSFSLYSNKISAYYIAVEENELNKLDRRLYKYFVEIKGLQGGKMIDVEKWSMDELNVPFYPETRVFKKIGKSFCQIGIKDEMIVFLELKTNGEYNGFSCKDLK